MLTRSGSLNKKFVFDSRPFVRQLPVVLLLVVPQVTDALLLRLSVQHILLDVQMLPANELMGRKNQHGMSDTDGHEDKTISWPVMGDLGANE
jgi:hypothetical protein